MTTEKSISLPEVLKTFQLFFQQPYFRSSCRLRADINSCLYMCYFYARHNVLISNFGKNIITIFIKKADSLFRQNFPLFWQIIYGEKADLGAKASLYACGVSRFAVWMAAPFIWLTPFCGLKPVSKFLGFWFNFVEGFAVLCLRRFNGFAVWRFAVWMANAVSMG